MVCKILKFLICQSVMSVLLPFGFDYSSSKHVWQKSADVLCFTILGATQRASQPARAVISYRSFQPPTTNHLIYRRLLPK